MKYTLTIETDDLSELHNLLHRRTDAAGIVTADIDDAPLVEPLKRGRKSKVDLQPAGAADTAPPAYTFSMLMDSITPMIISDKLTAGDITDRLAPLGLTMVNLPAQNADMLIQAARALGVKNV